MAKKVLNIQVDTLKKNLVPYDGINEEDSVKIIVNVTENGRIKDLSNQTVKLFVKRADDTLFEQTENITISNAIQGIVTIELGNKAINREGLSLFQLEFTSNDGSVTSSIFLIKVGKGLFGIEALENTNEVKALKTIEGYVSKAEKELEEFKRVVMEINNNEDVRKTNEVKREANEVKREEYYNSFKNKIDSIETEIRNARVATTGENFNSLDDRIDTEIERINKKIDFDFIEQPRKQKHDISNTVYGMTKNMKIYGKSVYKKNNGDYTEIWEEGANLVSFGEDNFNRIKICSGGRNRCINKEENWFINSSNAIQQDELTISYVAKILKAGTYYLKTVGGDRAVMGFFSKFPEVGAIAESRTDNGVITVDKPGFVVCYVLVDKNAGEVSNVSVMEEQEWGYEEYKESKREIILEEPLRGFNGVFDEIKEENNKIKLLRKLGVRKYKQGDENDNKVLTDKKNTCYILEKLKVVVVEEVKNLELQTYSGKTYVYFSNVLCGESSFEALINKSKELSRLSSENGNIEQKKNEILNKMQTIKQESSDNNELINVTMTAIDELYTMIESVIGRKGGK